jgi:hypothetical protein
MNVFKNSGRVVLGLAVALAMSLASQASAADTGKVTGKVLGKDGTGVAGVQVMLRTPPEKGSAPAPGEGKGKGQGQGKPVAKGTTESDGSFTLDNVPAGDYMLAARSKDQGQAREKVSVKAGETADVKLTLKQGKGGKGGGKKKAE